MTIRRRLKSIRLDKIAAVDRPCQEHATLAIIKRAPAQDAPPAIYKKTFEEALNAQLVSERISDVFWRAFDNQYAVREAFRTALADELAEGGDGTKATEGFTAAMQTIAETAATLAREAGAQADTDLESAVEQAVEKWLKQQGSDEMTITTKAALLAAVSAFDPAVTPVAKALEIKKAAKDLNLEDQLPAEGPLAVEKASPDVADLQKQVKVLSLSGDIRKHYDGLAADQQDAFLALSATDQASTVEKANAGDPVVYTTADGTEIRKSDGGAVLALAKRNDALVAEVSVLKSGRSADTLEKRAAAYPNVAKGVATDMLKSVDAVGADSDAGKAIIKSLEAMNKGTGGLMKSLGTTEAPEIGGDVKKARNDFNAEVSKIMGRDKVGLADAMSKARVEQPALFAEAYPETVEMDAEA